jgi:hypothetical protein
MAERRRYARVALNIPTVVTLEDGDQVSGILQNLSLGGLYLEVDWRLPVGAHCEVEICLCDEGDPLNIWIEGRVTRATDRGAAIVATAVFQDSLDNLRELLQIEGKLAA